MFLERFQLRQSFYWACILFLEAEIQKQFQWRYYSKYSMDCHMLKLAKAEEGKLKLVELDEGYSYTDGGTSYIYDVYVIMINHFFIA